MKLESVIQSEVSLKEKKKYHILMHIYMESRKMTLMNLVARQQERCRHREQTCHSGEMRGWDELREEHGNIYIAIPKIERKWEFAV